MNLTDLILVHNSPRCCSQICVHVLGEVCECARVHAHTCVSMRSVLFIQSHNTRKLSRRARWSGLPCHPASVGGRVRPESYEFDIQRFFCHFQHCILKQGTEYPFLKFFVCMCVCACHMSTYEYMPYEYRCPGRPGEGIEPPHNWS